MKERDLSIIMPAYNEAELISHALSSIREQLQGVSHEIIVVDNGSTDATAELAAQFSNVRVLSIPKSTISRARNCGARIATGRLFVFLDADVVITADWAQAVRRRLVDAGEGADYFGGFPCDIPDGASVIERAWFVASSLRRSTYIGSANLIVSASVFGRANGFDESLRTAEDVDFARRVLRTGQAIDFDPAFHAIHLGFPRTLSHFIRREIWHGLGSFTSFSSFIRSKVSMAAVLALALFVGGVVSLALGHVAAALIALACYLLMPLLFVLYRFRLQNSRYLPVQYILGCTYLMARAVSGVLSILRPQR